MINMDNLDSIINEASESTSVPLPDWTGKNSNALSCYETMISLREEKLEFINTTKYSEELLPKKSGKITKREVAERTNTTPQYLFSVSAFSSNASYMLSNINEELSRAKAKKLNPINNGLASMKKKFWSTKPNNKQHLLNSWKVNLLLRVLTKFYQF